MQEETKRLNGIPANGGIAHDEGYFAGECPYLEGDSDFDRWNEEWDAAADKAIELEMAAKEARHKVGSVVTNRYRAMYSEMGHPTHCGDALANLLNSICVNKAGTNIAIFERICEVNNVDLSKYNRTGKGWQGRLRMTGRNLLAKRVLANQGRLAMPDEMGGEPYQLDEDWMVRTANKYKPKME